MTHLHFDHSGGTTRRTASGGFEPLFRKARHVVQRREWEDATHPHERNRASYLQENVGPLGEAGLLQLVDGETEIAPGVRVIPTPGHTAGHQSVLIGPPDGPKALFLGDVVPTAVHVRLPWVMAYDLEPARNVETKRDRSSRARWPRTGCSSGATTAITRPAAWASTRTAPSWSASWSRSDRRRRSVGARRSPQKRPRCRRSDTVGARCALTKAAQSLASGLPRGTGDAGERAGWLSLGLSTLVPGRVR